MKYPFFADWPYKKIIPKGHSAPKYTNFEGKARIEKTPLFVNIFQKRPKTFLWRVFFSNKFALGAEHFFAYQTLQYLVW